MSDTPRTDYVARGCFENDKSDYDAYAVMLNHARKLERELSTRHVTPLQAAERSFIEKYNLYDTLSRNPANDSDYQEMLSGSWAEMNAAWGRLQNVKEKING